eukprot:3139367-Karenia_brevis.AAC.1
MTVVDTPYLKILLTEFASAPRPGAVHIAMTMVNRPYLTSNVVPWKNQLCPGKVQLAGGGLRIADRQWKNIVFHQ